MRRRPNILPLVRLVEQGCARLNFDRKQQAVNPRNAD
jgi:hypothetical protein